MKLSMLAAQCGLPVLIMLIRTLYPDETPGWLVRFAQISGLVFAIITIFTPDGINSYLLLPYEITAVLIAFGSLFIICRAMIRKRDWAYIMIFATGAFFLIVLNEVLTDTGLIQSPMILPIGGFALPCALAFILARRFSKSFTTIEVLSERLLFLDRLKDEFLANTSHELRTPLNGIVGMAESMIEGAAGKLDEKQAYHLSMIASSGKRLAILVNDILDFSKLKDNEIVLQKKPVDIRQVVEIVLALSEPLARARSLVLSNRLEEDLPLVDADENRVQQILHNIIGNAIKFTESGYIEISAIVKAHFLEISVSDTGIGIPEDKIGAIFNPFVQQDGSISREHGGTGLGLSITQRLVELHGGAISVESKTGNGSIFTFTLPVSIQSEKTERKVRDAKVLKIHHDRAPDQPKPPAPGIYRILVVDDEPVNRQVMINYLSLEHYSVETASNGEEALQLISGGKNEGFDLAILDIMMPRMSGYQLCRRLREKYSLIELPILILTARDQSGDIIAGFESGANDYLSKPFDKRELLARVNMLLNLKRSGVQEKMLRQAELNALQAQIKPHFLLNTLNTIIYFCRTNPAKAGELLTELGIYLRSCFDFRNSGELVPLENELEIVRSYLAIAQSRFNDIIKISYDIEPNLDCRVPSFMLQPIVENALKHGLLPKKEGGVIRISARKEPGFLVLSVADDGVGMTEYKIRNLLNGNERHEGVGINNVNLRLKSIYGRSLEIKSRPGIGTTVTIQIPLEDGGKHDQRDTGG
jgi:signal transduction histidine kinase